MMIFETLKLYPGGFKVADVRNFTEEEIQSVESAEVVPSEYGSSVCFAMKSGGKAYIPMSRDATLGIGESVDMTKALLLTLVRPGEKIIRVEI